MAPLRASDGATHAPSSSLWSSFLQSPFKKLLESTAAKSQLAPVYGSANEAGRPGPVLGIAVERLEGQSQMMPLHPTASSGSGSPIAAFGFGADGGSASSRVHGGGSVSPSGTNLLVMASVASMHSKGRASAKNADSPTAAAGAAGAGGAGGAGGGVGGAGGGGGNASRRRAGSMGGTGSAAAGGGSVGAAPGGAAPAASGAASASSSSASGGLRIVVATPRSIERFRPTGPVHRRISLIGPEIMSCFASEVVPGLGSVMVYGNAGGRVKVLCRHTSQDLLVCDTLAMDAGLFDEWQLGAGGPAGLASPFADAPALPTLREPRDAVEAGAARAVARFVAALGCAFPPQTLEGNVCLIDSVLDAADAAAAAAAAAGLETARPGAASAWPPEDGSVDSAGGGGDGGGGGGGGGGGHGSANALDGAPAFAGAFRAAYVSPDVVEALLIFRLLYVHLLASRADPGGGAAQRQRRAAAAAGDSASVTVLDSGCSSAAKSPAAPAAPSPKAAARRATAPGTAAPNAGSPSATPPSATSPKGAPPSSSPPTPQPILAHSSSSVTSDSPTASPPPSPPSPAAASLPPLFATPVLRLLRGVRRRVLSCAPGGPLAAGREVCCFAAERGFLGQARVLFAGMRDGTVYGWELPSGLLRFVVASPETGRVTLVQQQRRRESQESSAESWGADYFARTPESEHVQQERRQVVRRPTAAARPPAETVAGESTPPPHRPALTKRNSAAPILQGGFRSGFRGRAGAGGAGGGGAGATSGASGSPYVAAMVLSPSNELWVAYRGGPASLASHIFVRDGRDGSLVWKVPLHADAPVDDLAVSESLNIVVALSRSGPPPAKRFFSQLSVVGTAGAAGGGSPINQLVMFDTVTRKRRTDIEQQLFAALGANTRKRSISYVRFIDAPRKAPGSAILLICGADGALRIFQLSANRAMLLQKMKRTTEPVCPITAALVDHSLDALFLGDASGVVSTVRSIQSWFSPAAAAAAVERGRIATWAESVVSATYNAGRADPGAAAGAPGDSPPPAPVAAVPEAPAGAAAGGAGGGSFSARSSGRGAKTAGFGGSSARSYASGPAVASPRSSPSSAGGGGGGGSSTRRSRKGSKLAPALPQPFAPRTLAKSGLGSMASIAAYFRGSVYPGGTGEAAQGGGGKSARESRTSTSNSGGSKAKRRSPALRSVSGGSDGSGAGGTPALLKTNSRNGIYLCEDPTAELRAAARHLEAQQQAAATAAAGHS